MRVVLASSSPRRNELMKKLGVSFEVIVKETEEKYDNLKTCYEQCMDIAKAKALNVYKEIEGDVIVIGSDTIVVYQKVIYGKPKNYNEAYSMLKKFSNDKHEVISSLCILVRKDNQEYIEMTYDKCDVYVDYLSDKEINDWIEKNDVYTRAGAYAIQDGFGKYIKKIDGDYFSIVGFPLHKVYQLLKKYGVIE
jgi:septum formation protein